MLIIIFWLLGALFIGAVFGTARTVGFWGAFLISLVASPLLGLIICLFFPTNEKDAREKQMLATQQATLQSIQQQKQTSVADELLKLKQLLDGGVITQTEYEQQKSKLL